MHKNAGRKQGIVVHFPSISIQTLKKRKQKKRFLEFVFFLASGLGRVSGSSAEGPDYTVKLRDIFLKSSESKYFLF
jgi:hypothetical protein